jgi:aspartate/glutamate racemase
MSTPVLHLASLLDSLSNFPVGCRHQGIHVPDGSLARCFEQLDDSGADVVVIVRNDCHLRHRGCQSFIPIPSPPPDEA